MKTKNRRKNNSKERWRVFCSVELPHSLRESLTQHIARLREAAPESQASWSRAESIHLTLKFLGEIPQSRVALLSTAVERVTDKTSALNIVVERTGIFPPQGVPRVLWIGVTDVYGKLARLYHCLEDECEKVGFSKEQRQFHPHLTLARLRKPQGARALALAHMELGFKSVEVRVGKLSVIRSELDPEGSKYTTIANHPLASVRQTSVY